MSYFLIYSPPPPKKKFFVWGAQTRKKKGKQKKKREPKQKKRKENRNKKKGKKERKERKKKESRKKKQKKRMLVHLRWKMSEHPAYPFHYAVAETTTVAEVCRMVRDTNNVWPGNPHFSIVRVCDSAGETALVDGARTVGELRTESGLCYLEFVAG